MRTPENIAAVAENVRKALSTSIHCRFQQLNISEISLRRIFRKGLGMTPYKVQLVEELKPMRFRFAKWAYDRLTEDADFCKKKKRSSFQMKLILILTSMYASKIVAFGVKKIHTNTLKSRCTQNEALFGVDFSPEA